MNTRQNAKWVSSIEQQLSTIQMPQHEREQVLHAARVAEAFVDAIEWVCNQAQRLSAEGFAKFSPKY